MTKPLKHVSVPDGWKLVPDHDPTPEMAQAFKDHSHCVTKSFAHAYRAMLSATPAPPQDEAMAVVDEQANDEGLWFAPRTVTEDILQRALRRLHAAVEQKSETECVRAVLAAMTQDAAGMSSQRELELLRQIEQLVVDRHALRTANATITRERDEAVARESVMREALNWYAVPITHGQFIICDGEDRSKISDMSGWGDRAREALAKLEKL